MKHSSRDVLAPPLLEPKSEGACKPQSSGPHFAVYSATLKKSTPMRVCYATLLVATAILASFGDASGATNLDQTQLAKMTSVDAVQPIEASTNRFLRRRKNYEDEEAVEEERSGFEGIAAKLDKSLLPSILKVANMDLGRASLTLQQMRLSFENRMAIQTLLRLSKEDRKAVLLLIK